MKTFVLNLSGYEAPGLSFRELRALFHQGAIERLTPCRSHREANWSTLDDLFPMLKYEARRGGVSLARSSGPIRRSATKLTAMPSLSELVRFLGGPV